MCTLKLYVKNCICNPRAQLHNNLTFKSILDKRNVCLDTYDAHYLKHLELLSTTYFISILLIETIFKMARSSLL